MEEAILGNSKGATYKSFILDVEIVIKKEGTVNIAERRVKNRNQRESYEDNQDTGRKNAPESNQRQNVYVVSAGQTNLRDISNQPKSDDLLVEKSKVSSKKEAPLTDHQTSVSSENSTHNANYNKQPNNKHIISKETDYSETLRETRHRKKRTHKMAHSSQVFKRKVEPADFLECNRIFMCNYVQLPRQHSDSALCCSYLGTTNKIIQQEYVESVGKKLKNAVSVGEIFSFLKPANNNWSEATNKKFCLSARDLGNMYSCGDCFVASNLKVSEEKCWEPHCTKRMLEENNPECQRTTSNITIAVNVDKSKINFTKYFSSLKFKNPPRDSNAENILTTKEVIIFRNTKKNHTQKKTVKFLKQIKNMKKSFFKQTDLMKRIFKKS